MSIDLILKIFKINVQFLLNFLILYKFQGRGRSIMVSAFIVMHDNVPIFELDNDEWQEAIESCPSLQNKHDILNFYERSANAWIEPKKDNYFDNEVILSQFERLFKLIKFKTCFYNHDIEVLVDNARTHSAKIYDVNLLNKSSGTICPYKTIEWTENGIVYKIDCFDSAGRSKGLLEIAKELNLISQNTMSRDIKLEELRKIVSEHKAFENWTKLEKLAEDYDVKIVWCPKFHCELNPIEGLWCDSKRFVRKYNDQSFDKLNILIIESFEKFKRSGINVKLWNRFWECVKMYNEGATYKDVLQTLFGAKQSDRVLNHKRNGDFNTLIEKSMFLFRLHIFKFVFLL